ncbi:MAG TPA: penicillin acylase family protein [Chitinophagaceae bacterium]|nr:penicillin acylase family protein [Chitinophagaceae bacterium]
MTPRKTHPCFLAILWLALFFPARPYAQVYAPGEIARWQAEARQVTIIRDHYGIPHIYGKTDADAVFGLLYAQCEDDFPRVEMNYVEKLGRMAEIKGAGSVWDDLLNRLVIDTAASIRDYHRAPVWLKKLCDAFADGVNYYLYTHPQVRPALLTHFEPWYPMMWTDGSIGAISTADISLGELRNFYSGEAPVALLPGRQEERVTGSNGFALAPRITASGHAILYINPHVTFYFRPEVHMVSDEGLNAYGAVTWGQFFIYQGFNEYCGWMHTSSYADAADSYVEKIRPRGKGYVYAYAGHLRPVMEKRITLHYRTDGGMESRVIRALFTHHGPVMARRNGAYLSLRADNRLASGLIQCWHRTKAHGLADFRKTLALYGNISNNTVFADRDGNIAYWHGNRIPRRDPRYDWSRPVDGSVKATEWQGLHSVEETVHLINPPNGWLQNCNSTPFTCAGANSPRRADYPRYMAPDGENFRGLNAVRVLSESSGYTLDQVIQAGYDRRLAAFEVLVPALVRGFDEQVKPTDTLYAWLAGPVAVLRNWDTRCGEASIATTLAVEWGQRLLPAIFRTPVVEDEEDDQVARFRHYAQTAPARELLDSLLATTRDLQGRFGRWQVPWGEINRFQRISGDMANHFDDRQPSLPVGFASSTWGMLPSYTSRTYPGTQKRYGVNGNSFICVVEFGRTVRAKSLLAGGESGDPHSPHFFDQGSLYSQGQFKDVLFYKPDVLAHAERTYHPGE